MHQELMDVIHVHFKHIFHAFKKQSRVVSQDLKMTKVDVNILLVLQGGKMMTKRALASELGFESNSLTRSLDRLIAQGTVTRSEDSADRPRVQLSLTSSGKQLTSSYVAQMPPFWQ